MLSSSDVANLQPPTLALFLVCGLLVLSVFILEQCLLLGKLWAL